MLLRLLARQAPLFFGALVLSAGVAGAGYGLGGWLYDRHLQEASDELKNMSIVISGHANLSMLAVNQSVSKVVDALQTQNPSNVASLNALADGPGLRAMLDDIVVDNPFLDGVFVIGADGRVDQRSRAGLVPADLIVDTDYMRSLKSARPGSFVLSAPFESYQFRTWMVNYSRRVSGPDGAFLGAVAGIVKLSSFSDLFDRINLQSKGSMAMYSGDGALLSWAPQAEIPFGPTLVGAELYESFVGPRRDGVTRAVSRYDGVERLLAIASAPDFPVSVMVAMGMPDVIAGWVAEMWWLARAVALVIFAIWLGAFRLAYTIDRFAGRRERRLVDESAAEQETILNYAIENISQGLAMFDRNGALVIYNKRYAEMYGLPATELIPGVAQEELQARLRRNGRGKAFERAGKAVDGAVLTYNHLKDGRIIAQRKKSLPDGGWVSTHEDVTDRREADRRIHELAAHDGLTGLFNRVEFTVQIEQKLADHCAHGVKFALLHIDLDGFKAVNDLCGPHGGDEALRQTAARLNQTVGPENSVFRVGGDGFAVIHRIETAPRDPAKLADRLIAALGEPYLIDGAR